MFGTAAGSSGLALLELLDFLGMLVGDTLDGGLVFLLERVRLPAQFFADRSGLALLEPLDLLGMLIDNALDGLHVCFVDGGLLVVMIYP